MPKLYIALIHYPVYNKNKETVTACITGFDLSDMARTAKTYGVEAFYIVNPLPSQKEFAQRIIDFWKEEDEFNLSRHEAFALIRFKCSLEETVKEIAGQNGQEPVLLATSARRKGSVSFTDFKFSQDRPYLLLFGTGSGMTEEVLRSADTVFEPIEGPGEYNHLSVRSAAAVVLDRLLGKR